MDIDIADIVERSKAKSTSVSNVASCKISLPVFERRRHDNMNRTCPIVSRSCANNTQLNDINDRGTRNSSGDQIP